MSAWTVFATILAAVHGEDDAICSMADAAIAWDAKSQLFVLFGGDPAAPGTGGTVIPSVVDSDVAFDPDLARCAWAGASSP